MKQHTYSIVETSNHPAPETAHILFLDAVGYSTLPLDRQTAVFRHLQEIVNNSPTVAEAAAHGDVIRTPTGDGMALAFFDQCPSAIRAARELAEQIEGGFAVRMGLHTGEVVRQLDVNGNMNISGDGINIAQRVMDFGDGGHILMSLAYATELQRAGDPAAADCHDIGVASAKHGMQIHLYNYHRPAVGTSDVPARVRMDDGWIRPRELRLGTAGHSLIVATLQILGWLLARPLQWRTHVTQIDPRLTPNFSVIDLTGPQIRRNRDLRALLLQVYLVCPALLSLVVLAVLLPFPTVGQGLSATAAVFNLFPGFLASKFYSDFLLPNSIPRFENPGRRFASVTAVFLILFLFSCLPNSILPSKFFPGWKARPLLRIRYGLPS